MTLLRPWFTRFSTVKVASRSCTFVTGFVVSALLLLSSCGDSQRSVQSPPTIVTTTNIIADCIRHMVPDEIQVVSLMGPGVDPHLYKASSGDLNLLKNADLVIANGLHLEGRLSDVLVKLGTSKPVISLGDLADNQQLRRVENGATDPHIWFDVALWRSVLRQAIPSLRTYFPKQQKAIDSLASWYLAQLDSTHKAVKQKLGEIPLNQRSLVTAHDAFGYYGRAYNIDVHALQGISTVSEFGVQDIRTLSQFVVDNKVRALFVETSVPSRSIEALAEAVRAKGHNVAIGGSLFSDALGGPTTAAGTYIGMVTTNTNTIVSALR